MITLEALLDGKYQVKGRLGSGAFGAVYVAEDRLLPGRQVALKVLSQHSLGTRDDLLWEMRNLANFHLPGVVQFYHHFEHEQQLVLVMEFCAGGSLHTRLASNGALHSDEALRHALVLCETLTAVHEHGIVHHDIKPANILFSLDGAIKIGDFGVANRNNGTRRYMTPEQLLGEPVARTDPRIDVYALGLTLMEMLTNESPFAGLDDDDALIARQTQDFVPRYLPLPLQDVLLRATHPTPEHRFQDMQEFAEALQARQAPVHIDRKRIDAQTLATKAEQALKRKAWKRAQKYSQQALHIAPDSIAAQVVAGRVNLLLRRTDAARELFTNALQRNPRIHVQKELGWLQLEESKLAQAVSLLSDHLERNAGDWEAASLLMKALFLAGRYGDADTLGRTLSALKTGDVCFHNNRLPCHILLGRLQASWFTDEKLATLKGPFLRYNFLVAREYLGNPSNYPAHYLKHKLLFQEYGFEQHAVAKERKRRAVAIRLPDGSRWEGDQPVITLGSARSNDVVIHAGDVSRQHGLLVNLPHELWYYDLESSCGSWLENLSVKGRVFLDGVHKLKLASQPLEIAAQRGLLV